MTGEWWIGIGTLIIGFLTLVVATISLKLQYSNIEHQKKRDETPLLKLYIETHKSDNAKINMPMFMYNSFLFIHNIGKCDVSINECFFDSKPISSCNLFLQPENITNIPLYSGSRISCHLASVAGLSKVITGKSIEIHGVVIESGKPFVIPFPLYEERI